MMQKDIIIGEKYYVKGKGHSILNNRPGYFKSEQIFIPKRVDRRRGRKGGYRYFMDDGKIYLKAGDIVPFKCSEMNCKECKRMGFTR